VTPRAIDMRPRRRGSGSRGGSVGGSQGGGGPRRPGGGDRGGRGTGVEVGAVEELGRRRGGVGGGG
jgi:modulator of FtsH protease HflK